MRIAKMFFCCFLMGTIIPTATFAQSNSNSQSARTVRVTGQLVDSASGKYIPFGSVLIKSSDGAQQFSMNTDSLGNFVFAHVPLGNYTLNAYFVGYPQISKPVTVFTTGNTFDIGKVTMRRSVNVLNEVSIVDYKELVKSKPDGLVYLADKDPTNKGTTAADLLRKVPMVTVDMDDNLSLRGNENVRVLINGKPSSIIATDVSDVLKQIPSDNIKSVEVITSPGAKYDAEGSAGVINIVTKQSFIKGISGRVFSGVSYNLVDKKVRGYGGAHLSYRHNKFGVSADLGGGHWSHTSVSNSTRKQFAGASDAQTLTQKTLNDGGGSFMWGRLSADYTFDSLNSISAGVGIHPGNWKSNSTQTTLFPAYGLDYVQDNNQNSPRHNYSFNASYNKKFRGHPGRKLDLLALFDHNNGNSNYLLNQNDLPDNTLTYQENNQNKTRRNEFTFQADYTEPLKHHHQKIETGVKYINRSTLSDYELLKKDSTTNGDWLMDPSRTNALNYTQQVAAAYGQFTSDLTQKLSIIAGVRYEYTDILGNLRDNGGSFHSQFNNILPSAILSYKLRQFDRLNLSYTQRIERPSIRYINPYVNSSDQLNISKGNPELSPERTHKVELDYNTVLGHSSINLATFYSHTNNGIEAFTNLDNGVAVTTYGNFAKDNTLGFNLFAGTTFFRKWRISLNGNLYYKSLSGTSMGVTNTGWQYDAHFSTSVEIYKGLMVSGFAMYRGRDVMLQGTRSGWYRYSVGLKQKILKGKGEISIAAENFLSSDIKGIRDYQYGDALYHTVDLRHARGIRIGFSYNFGQMHFDKPRQQKQINNNDLKQDNNNNSMGDGMPQTGG